MHYDNYDDALEAFYEHYGEDTELSPEDYLIFFSFNPIGCDACFESYKLRIEE